jgi:hypothetical protein
MERKTVNDRIEMLTRNLERLRIIGDLLESIRTCNEDKAKECDVCVGMRFSINIINRRMEKE